MNGDPENAHVVIGTETFEVSAERPFVFGRNDGDGVVGLDRNDMGISAVAGSFEAAWAVWWVVNQSTKRVLLLQYPGEPNRLTLLPGHRHALVTDRTEVLVPGSIYTHVLTVSLPEVYLSHLRIGTGRKSTGTELEVHVTLTENERRAVVGLCSGYLQPFPHRREHPNTYAAAARLLGGAWNATKVRKAVDRVKARYAAQGKYFEGPQANYELAACLILNGVLTGDDLRLLARLN